jgi:uncharacterized protein (DUF927 family)
MATRETHSSDTLSVAPEDVPSVDREAIRSYIGPLHELAAPYAQFGHLVVSYQDARLVDEKGSFKQARYAIGPEHAERMVDDIVALCGNPHINVWVELRVVKKDAPKRGMKSETLAVLALAVDDDVDSGKGSAVLPVKPSRVLQTSEKNRQQQFFFKEPLAPDVADRLGKKLRKVAGADDCTGNCAQPFRIAGTPNWPTAKKVKERGRSPIPFLVSEVGSPGDAVDAMEFEETLDTELENRAKAKKEAHDGARQHHHKGTSGKPTLRHLTEQQRRLLQYAGNDSVNRSAVWQSACWRLFLKGFSVESVAEFFAPIAQSCADGFAAKYVGRIDEEVQRSYEKFLNRPKRNATHQNQESDRNDSMRPSWLPQGYFVSEGSIIKQIVTKKLEEFEVRVCSFFEYRGTGVDPTTGEQLLVIDVPDKLEPSHKLRALIPRAHLADNGNAYRAHLLRLGLEIPGDKDAREGLHELLNALQRSDDVRIATQTGWFCESFVTRETVIKAPGEPAEYILRLPVEPFAERATRGSLQDWNSHIGRYIEPNSNLVVAACQAMSGPLLKLTDDPSSVLHFIGDSSTGKTTILQAGLSVAGKPVFGAALETWRATDNALENTLAARNDLCLGLDEMSQISPRAAGQAAYMIAQGSGKSRMAHNSEPRPTRRWRCAIVSTGEIDLETKLAEAGETGRAGQEVRVIGVPADAGKGLGAFDDVCGMKGGDMFAQNLRTAALNSYGMPMLEWINRLVDQRDALVDRIRARRRESRGILLPRQGDVSGQVSRVADLFALLAAVGETLIEQKIFNWKPGVALAAVKVVFDRWVTSRGGVGPAEHERMLRALRRAIEVRQQAFLPMQNPPQHKPVEVLGYIDEDATSTDGRRRAGPRRIMLTASGFAAVFKGFRRDAIIAFMSANRYLLPGKSDTTIIVRPEHEPKVRVYAFDLARVLDASEPEEPSTDDRQAAEEAFAEIKRLLEMATR